MFLTKEYAEESLRVLKYYENIPSGTEPKAAIAKGVAERLFKDFKYLTSEERMDIIEMILEDMSKNEIYNLN